MKSKYTLLALLLAVNTLVFGQDEIKDLLKGGASDVNYLATGYTSPALKAFGYGLNQGWYNTAKPHKTLGFDITVSTSLITIPTADLTFNVDNSKLSSISLINPATGLATNGPVPTLAGVDSPLPRYQYKTSSGALIPNSTANPTQFNGPGGLNLSKNTSGYLPVPMAQIGIGLPKGFDLKVRYIPSTSLGSIKGSVSMIGFGLMHDIKQYIPVLSELPFDLSVFAGYTKFNLEVGLDDLKPKNVATYEGTATTFQALISKKFSVVTFYGSLGYNMATTTLGIKGTYDVGTTLLPATLTDPINLSVASSGPRATAGMRLKLLVFTFHGDYTLQEYSTLTVGMGISVR